MVKRKNGNGRRATGNAGNGVSHQPQRTLTRTFRYMQRFDLNNSTGSGLDQYAYYSKFITFNPEKAYGFRDAKRTFELWRARRARVYIQPGYNSYNQTYNTVNLDSALATTVWVASDFGINETISGIDLMSYQNARFHSLSINNYKKIVDTQLRINNTNDTAIPVFPASTWLDTSLDMADIKYSGFQIFTMMQGVSATNYLPKYQMIIEVDCEFKQPAWQNISTSFEAEAFNATLLCDINDTEQRLYNLVKVTRSEDESTLRFERNDGEPGSLTYTIPDFFEVFKTGYNKGYFGDRKVVYTGPIPPKE
jgi:hypothetical protein